MEDDAASSSQHRVADFCRSMYSLIRYLISEGIGQLKRTLAKPFQFHLHIIRKVFAMGVKQEQGVSLSAGIQAVHDSLLRRFSD